MPNNTLKSKFNFKTILLFVYVILLFGLLSVHMFNRFQEESKFEFWIFLMFFILFLITTFFTLSFFETIKVNEHNIVIKNAYRERIIPFSLIEKAELSKIIEYYGFFLDSTHLHLKNGKNIILYPFKYSNFYKIKMVMNKIINLNESINIEEPEFINFKIKNSIFNLKTYNTSHLLSITGILFYGIVLAFLLGLFKNVNSIESFPLFFISFFLLFFLISRDMNYFEVNETHLIIKNSIQFWKKSNFQLDEINSIEILKLYRKPGYLIVVNTRYYDNKTFHSDNLFDKEWDRFIEHLKSEQIQVLDKRNYSNKRILY